MTFAAASADRQGRPGRRPVRKTPLVRPFETLDGVSLPAYRGDIVNDIAFTPEARAPRPAPAVRGLSPVGGDAEPAARFRHRRLRQPGERPSLDARLRQGQPAVRSAIRKLADRITQTLGFMRAIGLDAEAHPNLRQTEFYTSHEALLLGYEQAMTRLDSTSGEYYATSGPYALDRRPHPPARRRACRIRPWRPQSHRPQMRPVACSPTSCCDWPTRSIPRASRGG